MRIHVRAVTAAAAEAAARAQPIEGILYVGPEDAAGLRDLAARVAAARPGCVRAATVRPDPEADAPLGRWPGWAAAGLLDRLVAPLPGTGPAVARLLAAAAGTPLWAWLEARAGERQRVRAQVAAARAAGLAGALLSAYDPARRDVIEAFAAEAGR